MFFEFELKFNSEHDTSCQRPLVKLPIGIIKNICISFLASHFILLTMMLFTFPRINSQIGKVFDLQTFGYSFTTATSIVENLNTEVTQLFLFPQLTLLDLLYPFLLALFLSSLLFRLINLTNTKNKVATIVLLIPFIAMLFDYSENICVILMITKSIDLSEAIVRISSAFTILKSVFTSISWLAILVYAFVWLRVKVLGLNRNEEIAKP